MRRFFKYTGVGVSTLLLDLALMFALADGLGWHYVAAASGAFAVAVSVNYAASRRYVFSGTLRGAGEGYAIFLSVAAAGMAAVAGGMYLLVDIFHWTYLPARLAVASATGLWSYLMNLYVNFKVAGVAARRG